MKHPVLTNKYGNEYLNRLNAEYLGTERTLSNEARNEKSVVVKWSDGNIGVVVVPGEDNPNNSCCVFGSLEDFAILYAESLAGIQPKWLPNGHPMWPSWYAELDDFKEFYATYREIIEDYL